MTHISLTLSDTDGNVSYALGDRQTFLKAVTILAVKAAEVLEMPLDDLLTTIKERAHEHRCYRR